MREYFVHRSLYHLKEGDPHAWAIPRLSGAAKAAFVAVEFDEFGAGRATGSHQQLFAELMTPPGWTPSTCDYLDAVPAESAGGGQRDVAVRAAPRASRRRGRSLRRHRDHVTRRDRAAGRRAAPDARTGALCRASTANTSRPTPCTSRWSAPTSSATWSRANRSWRRDVVFGIRAFDVVESRFADHVWPAGRPANRHCAESSPDASPARLHRRWLVSHNG